MAGFPSAGMKRKEKEEFPDGQLFPPARKVLRLDVDFFPSMEEEPAVPLVFEQQLPQEQIYSVTQMGFLTTETMSPTVPGFSSNEERSLILYNPVKASLLLPSGPSNFPLKVDSDLIAGLKSRAFWPGNPMTIEKTPIDDTESMSSNCLAIVPWVPSVASTTMHGIGDSRSRSGQSEEPMEADAASEGALMEVEIEREQAATSGMGGEGFQKWQQYCAIPKPLPSTSAPMMWSW